MLRKRGAIANNASRKEEVDLVALAWADLDSLTGSSAGSGGSSPERETDLNNGKRLSPSEGLLRMEVKPTVIPGTKREDNEVHILEARHLLHTILTKKYIMDQSSMVLHSDFESGIRITVGEDGVNRVWMPSPGYLISNAKKYFVDPTSPSQKKEKKDKADEEEDDSLCSINNSRCDIVSMDRGDKGKDPITEEEFVATGDVCICYVHGYQHVCGIHCKRSRKIDKKEGYSCSITGRVLGTVVDSCFFSVAGGRGLDDEEDAMAEELDVSNPVNYSSSYYDSSSSYGGRDLNGFDDYEHPKSNSSKPNGSTPSGVDAHSRKGRRGGRQNAFVSSKISRMNAYEREAEAYRMMGTVKVNDQVQPSVVPMKQEDRWKLAMMGGSKYKVRRKRRQSSSSSSSSHSSTQSSDKSEVDVEEERVRMGDEAFLSLIKKIPGASDCRDVKDIERRYEDVRRMCVILTSKTEIDRYVNYYNYDTETQAKKDIEEYIRTTKDYGFLRDVTITSIYMNKLGKRFSELKPLFYTTQPSVQFIESYVKCIMKCWDVVRASPKLSSNGGKEGSTITVSSDDKSTEESCDTSFKHGVFMEVAMAAIYSLGKGFSMKAQYDTTTRIVSNVTEKGTKPGNRKIIVPFLPSVRINIIPESAVSKSGYFTLISKKKSKPTRGGGGSSSEASTHTSLVPTSSKRRAVLSGATVTTAYTSITSSSGSRDIISMANTNTSRRGASLRNTQGNSGTKSTTMTSTPSYYAAILNSRKKGNGATPPPTSPVVISNSPTSPRTAPGPQNNAVRKRPRTDVDDDDLDNLVAFPMGGAPPPGASTIDPETIHYMNLLSSLSPMKSKGMLQSCYSSILDSGRSVEEIASMLVSPPKGLTGFLDEVHPRCIVHEDGTSVDLLKQAKETGDDDNDDNNVM